MQHHDNPGWRRHAERLCRPRWPQSERRPRRRPAGRPGVRVEFLEIRELLSPLDGLVGYWKLDDGAGMVASDASGHGHDGSISGNPVWSAGQVDGGLTLDGAGDSILVPDSPDLEVAGAITLAAWIRPQRFADQVIIKKARSGAVDGYELGLSVNGDVFVRFNQTSSGNTYRLGSYKAYPADGSRWIHVAATYDGALIRLYINGVEEAADFATLSIVTNNLSLGLGFQDDGKLRFDGGLDDVRIYNRALSDAEIQEIVGVPRATKQFITPMSVTQSTGEKPQSKVWRHDQTWWTVLPNQTGTWVWRLDGDSWTPVLKIADETAAKADTKEVGPVTHILLKEDQSTRLASVEYVPPSNGAPGTYQLWSARPDLVDIGLDRGVDTASIDVDSTGRMWLVSDAISDIRVRFADSPYSSFTQPLTIATGVSSNDISVVTALPNHTIGVLWSNQHTQRFGFRTHVDGADPTLWSADEVPASQSALSVGGGMADGHLNVAVASDGTLYAAVKTSYDTPGFPAIGLLVRRPSGIWDPLYKVDNKGTRPLVLLNEPMGQLLLVYSKSFDLVYKQTPVNNLRFRQKRTLVPGRLIDVSSTKQNVSGDAVIIASGRDPQIASGVRLILPPLAPGGGVIAAAQDSRPAGGAVASVRAGAAGAVADAMASGGVRPSESSPVAPLDSAPPSNEWQPIPAARADAVLESVSGTGALLDSIVPSL